MFMRPLWLIIYQLSTSSALASIHIRSVDLPFLINESPLIIIGEPIDQPPEKVNVKITQPESADQHYPDFTFTLTSIKVVEVLHTHHRSDSVMTQQELKVASAYTLRGGKAEVLVSLGHRSERVNRPSP